MSAGADCAYTLSDETEEMDLDQLIEFLEPQPSRPDPKNPKKLLPARAGAVIMSAEDFNKNMTALEQACKLLGSSCKYEVQKKMKKAGARVNAVAR